MRVAKLYTSEFKVFFTEKEAFSVHDIFSFYQSLEPNIAHSTVSWRIYELVQNGFIQRLGRGFYSFGSSKFFVPTISMKMFKINQFMKDQFPYLKYILWHIGDINSFSQHLFNKNIIFVEVERNAIESVTEILRDKFKYVIDSRWNDNLFLDESLIVVRPLVTGAPIQCLRNVPTTTLEKILVDIFADKYFDFLQSFELNHIFENAISNYTIHNERLLRYASRKMKRDAINDFIKSIKRQKGEKTVNNPIQL